MNTFTKLATIGMMLFTYQLVKAEGGAQPSQPSGTEKPVMENKPVKKLNKGFNLKGFKLKGKKVKTEANQKVEQTSGAATEAVNQNK